MSFLDLSDLGLVLTASELANEGLAYLQASIPGYTPNPGNLEVIQLEANSVPLADVAATIPVVSRAIWRKFGTDLVGVPYLQGAAAQTQVTFNVVDTAGYVIPAGTTVTLNSLPFFLVADLTIAAGSTSATSTVIAAQSGTAYNGVTGPADLVTPITFVTSVTATGPSYGGQDQEDDTAYQNRLVSELRLQAPRPITAQDYAIMATSFPPTPGTDQQEVGRAAAIDGYSPASHTFTANTSSSSTTLSAVSSFTGISAASGGQPGSQITGAGIPANTTVVTVNTGASTLVMSNAATATASGVTLSSVGSYGNARNVGVWITLADGTACNSDTLTAVQAWFESYREVNFIVNVLSPTYTPVYVTAQVHPYPGVDPTSLGTSVQGAIINYLSPPFWGVPTIGQGSVPGWFNQPWVYYSQLMAVVQNVRGVQEIPPGQLKVGLSSSPTGTTDLLLPGGPAPIPTSSVSTVTVTVV